MPATEGTFDQSWDQKQDSNDWPPLNPKNGDATSLPVDVLQGQFRSVSIRNDDDDDGESKNFPRHNESSSSLNQATWRSLPIKENHEQFLRDFMDIVIEKAVFEGTSRKNRVVEWTAPIDLLSAINLNPEDKGLTHEDLLSLAKSVIRYSVKTGHPRFINQLYSSIDPYGLAAQWLTDALNPSVYTFEVSPVFSVMEEVVLKEMRKIVGWPDGKGDGIFCPGGSMANGYAVNIARHHQFPQLKETGLSQGPRLVVFTSEDAHYSIKKLCAYLGIGTSNVYSVRVDSRGKMMLDDLEAQIQRAVAECGVPLMVSATAGTTVIGAFDPLRGIADICRKYKIWLHVDAAWGGGALVSAKYSHLLDGIELADSVTWNPHKLLAAPQQCSTLLTRHENLLQAAHSANATYLFQKDKFYDTSYDSGDKHIQCGRRADVFKFWFMWKAKGSDGLESHIDRVFQLSEYFADTIRGRDGWKLLVEPECTNVCFWYVPPSKRHLKGEELTLALQKIAPLIKEKMVRKGSMLITYQPLREHPNFFRLVLQNSGVTESDVMFFIEEIERLSYKL
ncbi:cysteine sulfinic acid decarboxylase [Neodiprion pinetum]|uniref:Cysteine sulfinic acid decarboxylase n=1 Tax=Neodiprion lecontei TaxID=441921 RepID=A0A6J0CCA6_NEOLC|nr:cysteine sulfinic acid decarboxylase [Neodiprion lecontei]XP_046471561.1 cysteine sulfinic acid decarboxylase [Neodiprion pinetum]